MRKLLVPVIVVAISLSIGFAVAEIALRVAGVGYPLFTRADEWTGFSLRPGAEGWQRAEGEAYVRINSQGLRDKEHQKAKPENVYRIAVLGDSYAEARQVPMEKTFWSVMENELQKCPALEGKKAEVINFGVSGFGTAQELLMLQRVWEYSPDVVLLAFTTGNDVRNNFYPLEKNPDKPYFYLEKGEMVTDLSFRNRDTFTSQMTTFSRMVQWAVNKSRVLQLVNTVRARMTANKAAQRLSSGSGAMAVGIRGTEQGLDTDVYMPTTPLWEDAWYITEQLLITMNAEVQNHGAKFMVATLSNGIQVHPDPTVRNAFASSLSVKDLFAPDRRVMVVGIENSFMVVLLAPILQGIAEKQHMFMHGFANTTLGEGHWNENGHREAGMYLATMLCSSVVP